MNSSNSILTEPFSNLVAASIKKSLTSSSNTFIGIGRSVNFGETNVEHAIYTTVYRNQIYKNLVSLKKINPADIQPVIPRVDWTSGNLYDNYDDMVEIYDYLDFTNLGTVNANANTTLQNTVVVVGASNVVTAYSSTNTNFNTYVFAGDQIAVNNEIKTVLYVANDTYLVVNSDFTNSNSNSPITLLGNGTIIVANTADFTSLESGNVVVIGEESKEIVAIRSNKILALNTALTYSNSDVMIRREDNTFSLFANTFYVRNSRDQVFKCLFNNGQANSTVEPTIDIDGQLPENAFILTSDGYKWKYMYTIPPGLKQKFFTKQWMPVANDAAVQVAAVDGRIDIISVLWGGSGYLNGGNSNSASIISVTNTDGLGANLSAKVSNGVITAVSILNGGNNYTTGTVTVNTVDGAQLPSIVLGGTINVSGTVIAANLSNTTYFVGNVYTNDILTINGESRNVVSVINNTSLTVNSAFNYAVTDGIGQITRSPAQFDISFSPQGGHGSNPARELGARDLMISVELSGDENATLPISDNFNQYHFNQISLVSEPLIANGAWTANLGNYSVATRLTVYDPGITNFENDETVYIGSTLGSATMVANVVHWDTVDNYLYINNITGTVGGTEIIKSANSGITTTVLEVSNSQIKLYSGDILYIENTKNVVRDDEQIEQIKIVLTF